MLFNVLHIILPRNHCITTSRPLTCPRRLKSSQSSIHCEKKKIHTSAVILLGRCTIFKCLSKLPGVFSTTSHLSHRQKDSLKMEQCSCNTCCSASSAAKVQTNAPGSFENRIKIHLKREHTVVTKLLILFY